jgi:hypothetical protein
MKRRQFVGYIGNTSLFLLAAKLPLYANDSIQPASEEFLFVEAEQFAKHGGWELDQQSIRSTRLKEGQRLQVAGTHIDRLVNAPRQQSE